MACSGFEFTRKEIDCASAVMNETQFDEVVEERQTLNMCSNLYCREEATPVKPQKLFDKPKPSTTLCGRPECLTEFKRTQANIKKQDSAFFDSHTTLDLAVQALQRYTQ